MWKCKWNGAGRKNSRLMLIWSKACFNSPDLKNEHAPHFQHTISASSSRMVSNSSSMLAAGTCLWVSLTMKSTSVISSPKKPDFPWDPWCIFLWSSCCSLTKFQILLVTRNQYLTQMCNALSTRLLWRNSMINHPCHIRMWQKNSADDTLVLEQHGTFLSNLHWVGTTLRMLDLCWMKQL